MKKILSTALLAATGFTLALIGSAPAFAVAPPVAYDWTGFYVGAHFGGVRAEFTGNSATAEAYDVGGHVLGGVQAGYNRQLPGGSFVIGLETDFSWTPLEATGTGLSFEEQWMSTVRGRMGYTVGNFLPFITAGLALTQSEWNISGTGSDSNLHVGHVYGAGVDFHCPDMGNWTGRAEYLHVDVPTIVANVNGTPATAGSGNDVFRIGVNYNF